MGYSRLCAQGFGCYEQHWVMVDMNDIVSRAQGSRCYEQVRAMDDMNEFRS